MLFPYQNSHFLGLILNKPLFKKNKTICTQQSDISQQALSPKFANTQIGHPLQTLPYGTTTVKLGDKERFDKEQVGVKESFPMTNRQFTS